MLTVVAGLIGVGKTSLCTALPGKKFYEPVESNVYLEDYYREPHKFAFIMQMNILMKRFKMFQQAHWDSLNGVDCIADRSIYEDYAFALVQREEGYMDEKVFKTYEEMHELFQSYLVFPDLILYLKAPVDTAMERINIRARDCEAGIPREYMEKLNKAYERLMPQLAKKCPVIELDATQDKNQVLMQALEAIEKRRPELEIHPRYKGGF